MPVAREQTQHGLRNIPLLFFWHSLAGLSIVWGGLRPRVGLGEELKPIPSRLKSNQGTGPQSSTTIFIPYIAISQQDNIRLPKATLALPQTHDLATGQPNHFYLHLEGEQLACFQAEGEAGSREVLKSLHSDTGLKEDCRDSHKSTLSNRVTSSQVSAVYSRQVTSLLFQDFSPEK